MDGGQQHDSRIRDESIEQLLFGRAYHQRYVGLANQRELLFTLGGSRALRGAATIELGESFLPQKMQIDGVEDDQRLGSERTHRIDVLGGNVVARYHNEIERFAMRTQILRNRTCIGMELHLDAQLLQAGYVRLPVLQVVGNEADLAPKAH